MDAFRWAARVTNDGQGSARVFVRKHQLTIGAPVSFDEAHPHVTALECLLGAVGADLANGLAELARTRRVPVDRVEALVQGELDDPLAHAGVVGASGHPGLSRIEVRLYVSTAEEESAVRALWDEVLERSALVRTLRPTVKLDLALVVSL
jgi:hypothetical protein